MCNINIVTNKRGRNDRRVAELMNVISYLSYDDNSDGEGFLRLSRTGNEVGRKLDKLVFRESAHTIVSHQRWATHGAKILEYTHPFETKDLIVFHNGVLSCAVGKHSDTYCFTQQLQENYDTYKDIKKAIEETHKLMTGFFSMVVYEKPTKRLLYYKNSSASFYYMKFGDYFVGSTKKENVEYACNYLKYSKGLIYSPINHMLYDVLDGFKEICELELETYFPEVQTNYYDSEDTFDGTSNKNPRTLNEFLTDESFPYDSPYSTKPKRESESDRYWRMKEEEADKFFEKEYQEKLKLYRR